MPARDEQLLVPQHDMAVVRRILCEKGKQPVVQPLLVEPFGVKSRKACGVERLGHG